jgi:hypothetical protein
MASGTISRPWMPFRAEEAKAAAAKAMAKPYRIHGCTWPLRKTIQAATRAATPKSCAISGWESLTRAHGDDVPQNDAARPIRPMAASSQPKRRTSVIDVRWRSSISSWHSSVARSWIRSTPCALAAPRGAGAAAAAAAAAV